MRQVEDLYLWQDNVDERLRRLESGGVGEQWHYVGDSGEPAYGTGWSGYASPYGGIRFKRTADLVIVQGLAQGTASNTNPIFTLPSGFRPYADASRTKILIYGCIGNASSVYYNFDVRIDTEGATYPQWGVMCT